MNEIKDYEIIDKAQELNAVSILDKFCKTFCRYADDYERFNDLRFRCEEECPFSQDDGKCSCKNLKINSHQIIKILVVWGIYKGENNE